MTASPTEKQTARRAATRWLWLLLRCCQIGLAALILERLPLPALEEWMPFKNLLVAVGAVILIGTTLFNTLFYDRYVP